MEGSKKKKDDLPTLVDISSKVGGGEEIGSDLKPSRRRMGNTGSRAPEAARATVQPSAAQPAPAQAATAPKKRPSYVTHVPGSWCPETPYGPQVVDMGPMLRAYEALSLLVQTLLMAALGQVFALVLLPYLAATGAWPAVVDVVEGLVGDVVNVQLLAQSMVGAGMAGALSVKACVYLRDGIIPGWKLAGALRSGFLHSLTSLPAIVDHAAALAASHSSIHASVFLFGCPLISAACFSAGARFAMSERLAKLRAQPSGVRPVGRCRLRRKVSGLCARPRSGW